MAQCEISRTTISNGIKKAVRDEIDKSTLFEGQDDVYTPKDLDSDYQRVINDINTSFKEEIIVDSSNPDASYTIVDPSETLINKYLPPQQEEMGEGLSPTQQKELSKLQSLGLISEQPHTINGRSYYKIPDYLGDRNEEAKDRLEQIIEDKGLDFVNVVYGADNYLVRLGTKVPEETDSIEDTKSTKAGAITKRRILQFLDNIGFRNIQPVSQLIYKGEKLKGSAYIDFMNGVMQIVEGQEDYTLPEESMHILVELIKEGRPELYSQMQADIINYKIYRQVVSDPLYAESNLYKDEDGNINYDKIKDEAIGKLLSEYLINSLEDTPESAQRLERVYNWWQSFIHWIRETFGAYKNPFKKALDELNQNDTTFGTFLDISSDDIFLSAKSVEEIDKENPDNKVVWQTIKNRPAALNITKEEEDGVSAYFKDGVKVAEGKRVTDIVDKYYKQLFGNRNFDDSMKEFYEQSRKDGSYIHEVFEEVINSYIDPTTGLMRRNPSPITFPLQGNPIQGKMVRDIQKFLKGFMAQFPQGTRFLTEQIVYDQAQDRYGTIDFMAIDPKGKVDIIDWKSMLLQDLFGAKDYKREGIFRQLNEYKRILKDDYNVQSFGKIRAIPIKKHYTTFQSGNRVLVRVEIGNSNPSKITQDEKYLRPIISPEESTGSDTRDEIATKLEALYKRYVDKGYFQKDRNILNDVQEAIYEIRVSASVDNLANYFVDLRTKFEQLFAEIPKLKSGTKDEISEALAMITFYEDIVKNVVEPSAYLLQDNTIDRKSREKLYEKATAINFLSRRLAEMRQLLLNTDAQREGIFDLLKPEKIVGFMKRTFRSMGSQDIATVRYMYELVKKSYNRIDMSTDTELKALKNLKKDFDTWRKEKGISADEAFGMLVDYDNGKLYSKVDKKFYDRREKVFESKSAQDIIFFVTQNYDMTDYESWYKTTLEENKKVWEASTYDQDKAKNRKIINSRISIFERTYNVHKYPVTAFGYHNPRIWGRNIMEDKWLSDKYKELKKNPPLLAMYDFFVQKNKELAATGAIKDSEAFTFLPNVMKTFADTLSFDDSNFLEKTKDVALTHLRNWRKSISVENYQLNYQGARDPFTGETLHKRFVPYIAKIDAKDKSFDLFSIYGLMTKEIYKEKYLQENDEILRGLVHIEKAKPNLLQNKFGVVAKGANNKPLVSNEKGKNAPILEEHVRAVADGEMIQYDADYVIQFKLRDKWNKSPLGKLYQFDTSPETYNPTSISTTKFVLWLNNANQKRILGLNAASAISNLFGGTYSSNKLYQRYVDKNDIHKSWLKMTSGSFYATEGMKKNAALVDYFLPLLNNRESFKSSQLSVSEASKILSQEWLMTPMRKTSEIVQLNIFLAVIENTGIIDGKLLNLREKAAQDTNYEGRYADGVSITERKEIEKKFTDKVKEYKQKYSLEKMARFKTIKEAGKDKVVVEIPGVQRSSAEVEHIREITQTMSKDSLGEADEFDIANYKYSIGWRLFMTFKNWIPRMADVRFGEFRYSQAHHAYEYGRLRMFARSLTASYFQTAVKMIPIPYLTNKVSDLVFTKEALIKKAKETYEIKKQAAKDMDKYDETTFISQGEFVDKFIQGAESSFSEFRTLVFMGAILFLGIAAPDDDDDSEDKAYKALVRRQLNKLIDEVGFFYSPKSGIDILGGGAPVFGMVRDSWYLFTDLNQQFFGFGIEQMGFEEKGQKMQKQAKPVKRIFKMFPILKEILTYLPAVDEQTAKEWGVRISDRRGY